MSLNITSALEREGNLGLELANLIWKWVYRFSHSRHKLYGRDLDAVQKRKEKKPCKDKAKADEGLDLK